MPWRSQILISLCRFILPNKAIVKCEARALITADKQAGDVDIHTARLFEICHQHFLCSRGQKRRSCQHFSQHNNSFPDIALPREITGTSGGWEALACRIPAPSSSLSPPSFSPHTFIFPFHLSPTSTPRGSSSAEGDIPLSSYTGPAAVNCSARMYYVQRATKGTVITLTSRVEMVETVTVAVVGILL